VSTPLGVAQYIRDDDDDDGDVDKDDVDDDDDDDDDNFSDMVTSHESIKCQLTMSVNVTAKPTVQGTLNVQTYFGNVTRINCRRLEWTADWAFRVWRRLNGDRKLFLNYQEPYDVWEVGRTHHRSAARGAVQQETPDRESVGVKCKRDWTKQHTC
jgi:plasmid maintenance system antidote protein VapI